MSEIQTAQTTGKTQKQQGEPQPMPQLPPKVIDLQDTSKSAAADWKQLMNKDIQSIVKGLDPQQLTKENINERIYQVLEKYSEKIPFFKQVLTAAKEKGYVFEMLNAGSPEEVREFFKSQDAFAATEKKSNKVYFDLEKMTVSWKKNQDKQSFGAVLSEMIANEGVHILEDNLKTDDDVLKVVKLKSGVGNLVGLMETAAAAKNEKKEPTELERQFRFDAVEDFVSTILGNLAGFNADKDLVEAMTAAKLPDERLNNKKLVMGLLSSFDESFGEYLSSIKGLDPASQRLVMQRQTGYAFSGEIEKVVESKLKGYGVLKADQSFPKLDFRAALEKK